MTARLGFMMCLAACGSASVPQGPQPSAAPIPARARALARDGALEGQVIDARTHEPLSGATIDAQEPGGNDDGNVVISDETGRFRMALPEGTYHVVIYYGDATVDRGQVEIDTREARKLDVGIDHAAVEEAKAYNERLHCPGQSQRSGTADVEALVSTVLDRIARDPSTLTDGDALPARGPIYVLRRVDGRVVPGAGGLPETGPRRFVAIDMRDLQAMADRMGAKVAYLALDRIEVAGDCATVSVGPGIVLPTRSGETGGPCSETDFYDKRGGRWVFRATALTICP